MRDKVVVNPGLVRTVEELTVYATERQAGFEAHQSRQARQPEERNDWIRGILAGMAEVFGADPGEFNQRLEAARGAFGVVPLNPFEQKHMIQSLCGYVNGLEQLEGDQRARIMEVRRLMEDVTAYLSWDVTRSGVYPAREQVEWQLLRMVLRRPIRFTRILVGGDFGLAVWSICLGGRTAWMLSAAPGFFRNSPAITQIERNGPQPARYVWAAGGGRLPV